MCNLIGLVNISLYRICKSKSKLTGIKAIHSDVLLNNIVHESLVFFYGAATKLEKVFFETMFALVHFVCVHVKTIHAIEYLMCKKFKTCIFNALCSIVSHRINIFKVNRADSGIGSRETATGQYYVCCV